MISRQPDIHVGLRIVAAGCIVLWLLASSYCNIEHLLGDDHHPAEAGASESLGHHDSDHSQEAEAAEYADGKASDSRDSEQPSHGSHPHNGGDNSCCTTLVTTPQITTPFVIARPLFQPLNLLCTVLLARHPIPAAPEVKPVHQTKPRDWIFTPEVRLGPAHFSLAPPSLA